MAETKEKLLEELYGLRAGLSVYSEEADKLHIMEDRCWEKEQEQINIATGIRGKLDRIDPLSEVEFLEYNHSPVIRKYIEEYRFDTAMFDRNSAYWDPDRSEETAKKCDEQSRLADKIYEKWLLSEEMEPAYLKIRSNFSNRDMKEEEKWIPKWRSSSIRSFIKLIFMALLVAAMVSVFVFFGLKRDDFWKWVMLGGIVVFAVLFVIALKDWWKDYAFYRELKRKVNSFRKEMQHPERTENMKAVYAARDRLKILIPEREEKTYPYVIKLENFYKALQKEYASVLDERNWKNLDLVIFALETGRADNLKEALRFVDGETRTRRVEKAIETATSQICSTIRSGFASLENTIQACCNKLSAQIQDIGGKILATNQQILSTQREMLTEQRFSNALLAKANVTSMQLMDDVHKIRNNSDYLNMRLRNG